MLWLELPGPCSEGQQAMPSQHTVEPGKPTVVDSQALAPEEHYCGQSRPKCLPQPPPVSGRGKYKHEEQQEGPTLRRGKQDHEDGPQNVTPVYQHAECRRRFLPEPQ